LFRLPPSHFVRLLIFIDHFRHIAEVIDRLPSFLLKAFPFNEVFGPPLQIDAFVEDRLNNEHHFHLFLTIHHYQKDIVRAYLPLLHMKMKKKQSSTFFTFNHMVVYVIIDGLAVTGYNKLMEPEDRNPAVSAKETVSPINRQINRYRNALPEVSREEGHFFFKEVTRQMEEITYVSIGYRIGNIPFELQDIVAVIINNIHYACEVNLKLILDRENLWVTGAIGIPTEELNSLRFRVEEAHLNESLLKTQRILAQFLE
jgi:hypothetical protein